MSAAKPKTIAHNWSWAYQPARRTQPVRYIIVHNTGGEGTVEGIHAYHKHSLHWAGIAYNFVVDLDGDIHEGRGEYLIGAHCYGFNAVSIGVSFIGNYNTRKKMPAAQFKAGVAILDYLTEKYPGAALIGHKAVNSTDCPGRNFPWIALQRAVSAESDEPETVPENVYPQLKRMLVELTKTQDSISREYWETRIDLDAKVWRRPAKVLAWRVSGHLKGIKQTARPTKELYDALAKELKQ